MFPNVLGLACEGLEMNTYKFLGIIFKKLGLRVPGVYGPLETGVKCTILGHDFRYDPDTDIGRRLYSHGGFEQEEIRFCHQYIKQQSVVVDIGANVGLHTLFFSEFARNGLVLSFEPARDTFFYLLGNVQHLKNVIPINIALSDAVGIAEFFAASDDAYSGLKDTKRKEIVNKYSVVSMRLDDILLPMNLDRIDFVKIDVEGLERNVLSGMAGIMEIHRPVLFCEIYKGDNSNEDPDETVHYVMGKGYHAFVLNGNGLARYTKHDDNYYNYFFLPL